MTGYATGTAKADGWTVSVEARSVNHRGLDMSLSVPRECAWLEPKIAELIRQKMHRGRIQVRVELDFDDAGGDVDVNYIDQARFEAVCAELRELSNNTATGPLTLGDVMALRDVFENKTAAQIEDTNAAPLAAAETAVGALVDSRNSEGEGIAQDLAGHLDSLRNNIERLEGMLPDETDAFRGRLKERVAKAVADFGAGDLDDERLAQELAYYADKSDVSEELQRAKSHVDTLRDILRSKAVSESTEAVGKTIDFYLQELIRETNTMGSKSSSAKGTDVIIEMKSTVERMREQAANIE
jgi:uncharacterized protein (TIGR00255 family)